MEADFLLVRIGLLGAPVLAVVIYILLRGRRFPARSVIVAASVLLLYLAIVFVGLRFVAVRANLACTIAAYFAYSLLAVMCLRISERGIRFLAFVIAIIPIACGYLLTTIRPWLLALAMIIVFYSATPNHVEEMAPGLTCRITERGWGGSLSSVYAVGLYKSWNWVLLLERKVIGALVMKNYPDAEDVSCAELIAGYEKPMIFAPQ
jgi:hypothetical protein